jgi:oligopeptide/dipeptide ABC transporter ATP-binding protein
MTETARPAFRADHVCAWIPDAARTLVVDRVSVEADAGRIVGIVGETGAGKTVTMRAIMGVLPGGLRAKGRLAIAGATVELADVERVRALLGTEMTAVLQNPHGMLDPLMRVGLQLAEGVVRKGILSKQDAIARATLLLEEMAFSDPAHVMSLYPHELSGGMAQRVAIAMGLMPRPRLLMIDEPTSALDANVRVDVLRIVQRLAAEQGTAVVMVSHDLGLVSHFCDSVFVLYGGRVVESGATADVVRAPAHPYTGALIETAPTIVTPRRQPLRVIPGAPPAPGAWPSGCVFSPRCPHATARCRADRPELRNHMKSRVACHYPRASTEP